MVGGGSQGWPLPLEGALDTPQPASSLTLGCPPGQQGQSLAEGAGRMAGSLTMGPLPHCPLPPEAGSGWEREEGRCFFWPGQWLSGKLVPVLWAGEWGGPGGWGTRVWVDSGHQAARQRCWWDNPHSPRSRAWRPTCSDTGELAGESNSEPLSHDRLDGTGVCKGPAQSEPDPAARGSQHAFHGQPQTPRRGHVIDCVCVHCLSKVEARSMWPKMFTGAAMDLTAPCLHFAEN